MCFWQIIVSCTHHSNIMQNSFTSLKLFPMLHLFNPLSLLPNPGNHRSLYHHFSFYFPEHLITEIIRNIAFSDQLLSTSNVYLRFSHVFLGLGSSQFFYSIPLYGGTCLFIHLLKDILGVSRSWRSKWGYYKNFLYRFLKSNSVCGFKFLKELSI